MPCFSLCHFNKIASEKLVPHWFLTRELLGVSELEQERFRKVLYCRQTYTKSEVHAAKKKCKARDLEKLKAEIEFAIEKSLTSFSKPVNKENCEE